MTDQNRNLLLRVVTAFTLLPLILWLLWLGGLAFALLLAVAAGACAFELNGMVAAMPLPDGERPSSALGAAVLSSGVASLMPLLALASVPARPQRPVLELVGAVSLPGLLVALLLLAMVDALFFERTTSRIPNRVGMAVLAPIYTGLTISSLVLLRELPHGAGWIVLSLSVTWLNDTGGYFAGRAFGKRKLYPRISPSKTWEGFFGGALGSVLGAVACKLLFIPSLALWGAALIGLGAAIMGPLGDLSESMLKRAFGAKDSGKLLPGHGGLLDRIDALLFVGPFVLVCARLLVTLP